MSTTAAGKPFFNRITVSTNRCLAAQAGVTTVWISP